MRDDERAEISVECPEQIDAPVSKGDIVGYVYYKLDGECYRSEAIICGDTVAKIDLTWCFQKIIERYFI